MVSITREDPRSPDLALLMQRHNDAMHQDTPPESIHMLKAADLAAPDIAFFALRDGGTALGMGAFRRIDADHAEIKSMHILTEARGRGLARHMLDHLIAAATAEGHRRLSLETGSAPSFAPARALYVNAGFAECAPFDHYQPDPNSVFMTRVIG